MFSTQSLGLRLEFGAVGAVPPMSLIHKCMENGGAGCRGGRHAVVDHPLPLPSPHSISPPRHAAPARFARVSKATARP